MSGRPRDPARRLDAVARAAVAGTVSRARRSGRTRWHVHGVDAPVGDPLAGFAAAEGQDRFYWEHPERSASFCAWGAVAETESAGRDRFEDVAAWVDRVRDRLDESGAGRPGTAPLLVGGFAFEDDGPSWGDWKGFPAARFVLPAVIVERGPACARRIVVARVEPSAT